MAGLPEPLRTASPSELKARFEAGRTGTPFLLYRDGADAQRITPLEEGRATVTIGRQPASDVPLTWDSAVSRVHATLERVGDEWTIVDDGSARNGSFLNGERVRGRRLLQNQDVLRLGGTTVVFLSPSRTRGPETVVGPSAPPPLTEAQRRVLVALCRPLVSEGQTLPLSNQQVADDLVVSVETVKSHLHALFPIFGVADLPQNHKRAALAHAAITRGVVTIHDIGDATWRQTPA